MHIFQVTQFFQSPKINVIWDPCIFSIMLLSAGAGDKSLNMARMCTTVGRSKFLNYGFEPLAFHGGGSSNFFFLFLGSKTVSIFHNLSCLQKTMTSISIILFLSLIIIENIQTYCSTNQSSTSH